MQEAHLSVSSKCAIKLSRPQTDLGAHAQRNGGFATFCRDGHWGRAVCHDAGRGHGHAHEWHGLALLAEIQAFDVMSAEPKATFEAESR